MAPSRYGMSHATTSTAIAARVAQRCVNAAERPLPGTMSAIARRLPLGGAAVGAASRHRAASSAAADDHDVVGERRQRRELALENRRAVDDERALVAAAEAGRLAAGENRLRARRIALQPS